MSLAGTPSMSTLVKLDDPPRTNTEAAPPRPPTCVIAAPGTVRIGSSRSVLPSVWISVESSTVTAAPTCDCGTSPAVALTTTCCVTPPICSPTSIAACAPAATNIASVVRFSKPAARTSIR